jgi:hypothetical protein
MKTMNTFIFCTSKSLSFFISLLFFFTLFSNDLLSQRPTRTKTRNLQAIQRLDPCPDVNCTANDITNVSFFLGDENGNPLDPVFPCVNRDTVSGVFLYVEFEVNANNRYDINAAGDIYINNVIDHSFDVCIGDYGKNDGLQTILIEEIKWACGDKLEIFDAIFSWDVQDGGDDPDACNTCPSIRSKCQKFQPILVQAPLVAWISYTDFCVVGDAFATLVFTNISTGGEKPYSVTWDFGDGSPVSTDDPAFHTYNSGGPFLVTLTVVDADGVSDTDTMTVTAAPCCEGLIIQCPADITVDCAVFDQNDPSTSGGSATFGCGTGTITFTDVLLPGDCSGAYVVERTWVATDDTGATDDCVQIITITDGTAPTLRPGAALPEGQTDINDCIANAPEGPSTAEMAELFEDDCGTVDVSRSVNRSGDDCSWTVTYEYTITDDCGNEVTPKPTVSYSGGDDNAPTLLPDAVLPQDVQDINDCKVNAPDGPGTAEIAALYEDDCGSVNVSRAMSMTGDDCAWTVTYEYTITDDCGNEVLPKLTVTYSGGDDNAPTLLPEANLPKDVRDINDCKVNAPDGPSTAEIAALYEDDCGSVNVSRAMSMTGDDCAWTVTYEFTITDDCGNEVSPKPTVTYSGGDDTAPTLLPGAVLPEDVDDINDCKANAPDGPSEEEIAELYEDDCGSVNVSRTMNMIGDDCDWTVTYEYTITDDCGNEVLPKPTVTYSGGDKNAPTLKIGETIPAGLPNIEDCLENAPEGPSEEEIAELFEDDCGSVTVTRTLTVSGDNGNWTVTYEYTVVDDCGNEVMPKPTVVFAGLDGNPPTLKPDANLPEGQSGINDCKDNAPDGPSEEEIAELFEDDCGNVNVSRTMDMMGDDCEWSVTYEYTVTDDSGNEVTPKPTVTYSGGDEDAPTLLPGGSLPDDIGDINDCKANAPDGPSTQEIAALYEDDCTEVNVSRKMSMTGDDCDWTVTYEYTITDDCGNEVTPKPTVTYSGGDEDAPTLRPEATLPEDVGDINDCKANAPDGPSIQEIAALYEDDCGTVNVSRSVSMAGDDCDWTVTYEYTITDDCGNEVTPKPTVTYSGGDEDAPTLKADASIPEGQSGINDCVDNAPEGPSEEEIGELFEDDCGTVNVTRTRTVSGNDGDWTVTYEYTIEDDCGNEVMPKPTVTYSGSDDNAPTLKPDAELPEDVDGINDCKANAPDGPSEQEIADLYEDDCGGVNVSRTMSMRGDDCEWSVTYEYTITDDSGNEVTPKPTVTYSGGDEDAPTLLPGASLPDDIGDINDCKANAPDGPSTREIAALYEDDCGTVNVSRSVSMTGDDCDWTVTYEYTITDDCGNEVTPKPSVTYSGSDEDAPTLLPDANLPDDIRDINDCKANAPDGPSRQEIAALYEDDCSNVNVTRSISMIGDDCAWTVTYEYTITDDCGNEVTPKPIVTYSGGDEDAPTLKAMASIPEGQSGINDCLDNAPEGPSEEEIGELFEDDCGTVNVTRTRTVSGNDGDWTVTYEYTIEDDCGNEVAPKPTVTYSGGDEDAPTLKPDAELPEDVDGINDCKENAPDGPSEEEIAELYEDDCGKVNVSRKMSMRGDDCEWSVTYEYTITDDVGNEVSPKPTVTYSGGDEKAPMLLPGANLPEDKSNINACKANAPEGPSKEEIAELYRDNCKGVNVSRSVSMTGDDCEWSVTYEYTITDDCGNEVSPKPAVTYSGGDFEAPNLKKGASFPDGQSGINDCKENAPDGPSAKEIEALFEDNCGDVTVFRERISRGNDCAWSVTYEYTIQDDCGNVVMPKPTVIYSGGDDNAPTLIAQTVLPPGQSGINDCMENAPKGPSEAEVAAMYQDDCGDVFVTRKIRRLGDDCDWTVIYEYTIQDNCGNTVLPKPMVEFSGGDKDAPTLKDLAQLPPSNDHVDACFSNAPDGPSESEIAALYEDDCGRVFVSRQKIIDNQGPTWSVTYIYTISDECGNIVFPKPVIEYSGLNVPDLTCKETGYIHIGEWEIEIDNGWIQNIGDVPSPAVEVCVILSPDYDFDDKDNYEIGRLDLEPLGPGENGEVSGYIDFSNLIGEIPYGTYYIALVVDCDNELKECDEHDNICPFNKTITLEAPKFPDLLCKENGRLNYDDWDISISDAWIVNMGTAPSEATNVCVYLSEDDDFLDEDNILIAEKELKALAVNETHGMNFWIELMKLGVDIPYGEYYLAIVLDCGNTVEELNEDNNICVYGRKIILEAPALPDLLCYETGSVYFDSIPSDIIDDVVIYKKDMLRLYVQDYQILNNGEAPSVATDVGVYVSADDTFGDPDDRYVGSFPVPALEPLESVLIEDSLDFSTQNLDPGAYYIGYILDDQEIVTEESEDNNQCYPFNKLYHLIEPLLECVCNEATEDYMCESFEKYYSETWLDPQTPCWTPYVSHENQGDEAIDALVRKKIGADGTKALRIDEEGQNMVLTLPNYTLDIYRTKWMMKVPKDSAAYVSVLNSEVELTYEPTKPIQGLQFTFGHTSSGKGLILETGTEFDYPEEEWFEVEIVFDFRFFSQIVWIKVNGVKVSEIGFYLGKSNIGAMNFAAPDPLHNFIVDNIQIEKLEAVPVDEEEVLKTVTGVDQDPLSSQDAEALAKAELDKNLDVKLPDIKRFYLYPNPSTGQFNMVVGLRNVQDVEVYIMNGMGQIVRMLPFDQVRQINQTVDLSDEAAGLYFIKVQAGEESLYQRILIER